MAKTPMKFVILTVFVALVFSTAVRGASRCTNRAAATEATTSPLTPAMINTMAEQGAEYAPGIGGQRTWDPAGFRAGVADMLAQPMTREGIQSFLRSNRLRVLPEELHLLVRELRGRTGFPHFGL